MLTITTPENVHLLQSTVIKLEKEGVETRSLTRGEILFLVRDLIILFRLRP